jgi:sugar/nucleoside kinase (ribokinase family)
MNTPIDFLCIGDTVTDAFIELQDATVSCDVNNEHCTITMGFGDKIPYRDVVILPAVGNSANAAVAGARLGLSTALVSDIGNDTAGTETLEHLQSEHIDTDLISVHTGIKTNYHYVLRYGAERTILVKHENYPYQFPAISQNPAWVYLSSLGNNTETYHDQIADYLENNPDIKLAFQPGTFQMKMGTEKLSRIYKRSHAFFCNKSEARKILNLPDAEYPELHTRLHALGPVIVVITDGPNGATISDTEHGYFIPMYPDPKPPVERTGAGDATSSTCVCALHLGYDLPTALSMGMINSMSVVQYVGAQAGLLNLDQIKELLDNKPDSFTLEKLW